MARARALLIFVLAIALLAPARAGILDLLWGGEEEGGEAADQRGERPAEAAAPLARNCSCAGAACHCCAALDFAYVDLGGPGCVTMRYVSPTEGIALNISYGESLLLSDSVKGAKPAPACLDLLSDLAQLCARVGQLAPTDDGLRWCLSLEPVLLGDPQASYPLGCFRMGAQGMRLDPALPPASAAAPAPAPATAPAPALPDSSLESAQETNSTENATEQLNEEELIAAVNQSAEEGIAFFSNLLGLTFGGAESGSDNSTVAASDEQNGTSTPLVETITPTPERNIN